MAPEKRRRGLRTGFTTGACAAAAARAAVVGLITGRVPEQIVCLLPNGQWASFAVSNGRLEKGLAHAVVVKDAGDDPDCTNGAHLTADIRPLPQAPGEVRLQGGPGIGTVTLPGLGLTVALNATIALRDGRQLSKTECYLAALGGDDRDARAYSRLG